MHVCLTWSDSSFNVSMHSSLWTGRIADSEAGSPGVGGWARSDSTSCMSRLEHSLRETEHDRGHTCVNRTASGWTDCL